MKRILALAVSVFASSSVSFADGSIGPVTITTTNDVAHIEAKDFTGTATKVEYDTVTGVLKLEGSAKSPATLRKRGQEISARALNVSLKTGRTIAHGIERLEFRP